MCAAPRVARRLAESEGRSIFAAAAAVQTETTSVSASHMCSGRIFARLLAKYSLRVELLVLDLSRYGGI